MSGAKRFLPPIPAGYRIFHSFEPAGLRKYRENFDRFYYASLHRFEIVPEPTNAYDKNAIMVIGVSSAGRDHLGYIDRETAKQIAATGLIDELMPRIDSIYRSADGYIEARFQLLGPKEEYSKFVGYVESLPPTKEQKDAAKFYDLSLKGLNRKEATMAIQEFEQQNEAAEGDWVTYCSILDTLDDREFRADYEIKKPKKSDLDAAFDTLKNRGYSYSAIEDDIDLLVDELKLQQNGGGVSEDAVRAARMFGGSYQRSPDWIPPTPPNDVKFIDTLHMRQRDDEIEDRAEKIRQEMMERKRTNSTFFILAVIIVVLVVAVKIFS